MEAETEVEECHQGRALSLSQVAVFRKVVSSVGELGTLQAHVHHLPLPHLVQFLRIPYLAVGTYVLILFSKGLVSPLHLARVNARSATTSSPAPQAYQLRPPLL